MSKYNLWDVFIDPQDDLIKIIKCSNTDKGITYTLEYIDSGLNIIISEEVLDIFIETGRYKICTDIYKINMEYNLFRKIKCNCCKNI